MILEVIALGLWFLNSSVLKTGKFPWTLSIKMVYMTQEKKKKIPVDDYSLYFWLFLGPFWLEDFWLEHSFESSLPAYPWMSIINGLGFFKDLESLLRGRSRVGGLRSPGRGQLCDSWKEREETSCSCYGCLSLIEGLMGLDWFKG